MLSRGRGLEGERCCQGGGGVRGREMSGGGGLGGERCCQGEEV